MIRIAAKHEIVGVRAVGMLHRLRHPDRMVFVLRQCFGPVLDRSAI